MCFSVQSFGRLKATLDSILSIAERGFAAVAEDIAEEHDTDESRYRHCHLKFARLS